MQLMGPRALPYGYSGIVVSENRGHIWGICIASIHAVADVLSNWWPGALQSRTDRTDSWAQLCGRFQFNTIDYYDLGWPATAKPYSNSTRHNGWFTSFDVRFIHVHF